MSWMPERWRGQDIVRRKKRADRGTDCSEKARAEKTVRGKNEKTVMRGRMDVERGGRRGVR